VWYLLQGDGRCYRASTEGSLASTVLAIYKPGITECEELSCVAQDDNTDTNGPIEVSWATTADVSYYILVAAPSNQTGEFTLTVAVSATFVFLWFNSIVIQQSHFANNASFTTTKNSRKKHVRKWRVKYAEMPL